MFLYFYNIFLIVPLYLLNHEVILCESNMVRTVSIVNEGLQTKIIVANNEPSDVIKNETDNKILKELLQIKTMLSVLTNNTGIIKNAVLKQRSAQTTNNIRMHLPSDCRDTEGKLSGQHQLYFPGRNLPTVVLCHMELLGGGWLVILNRFNGNLDFYQEYYAYVKGFGSFADEFWLGLDQIRAYMDANNNKTFELMVLLEDFDGNTRFARYKTFNIGSANDSYPLTIGDYEGTAGDSMGSSNGMKFSAYDKDWDLTSENCAIVHRSAGWFKNCTDSNIFGKYLKGKTNDSKQGMFWATFRDTNYSLKSIKLLLRTHSFY